MKNPLTISKIGFPGQIDVLPREIGTSPGEKPTMFSESSTVIVVLWEKYN